MKEKKNILFVIPGLHAGGGEKALVNLLNEIIAYDYQIDLLLFHKSGLFLNQVPENVNIIQPQGDFATFSLPLMHAVKSFLFKGKIAMATNRIKYAQELRKHSNPAIAEQQSWKYWSKSMPQLNKVYDTAIAFLEKSSIYYLVDKVNARKKIGWIHNDYTKLQLDKNFDKPYLQQLQYIATVSENCKEVLTQTFPELSDRVKVIYNITSKQLIHKLAIAEDVDFHTNKINIVSVGRLENQKGFDIAIEAVSQLPDTIKQKIKWYIIGEGIERNNLESLLKQHNVKDNFVLLGLKANPYPFVHQATIYCQPSRFEGKSIAIDEAKLLAKPILTTDFTTVKDQLEHNQTAWIVPIDSQSLKNGLMQLINDEELRQKLHHNLTNFDLHAHETLEKINSIIQN